jgi:hypothetical protein
MTPKGHSPVDLEPGAALPRRSLLGVVGAAGAVALAAARPASASAPFTTTTRDRELLGAAMQLELAAARLYRDAEAAGLRDVALLVAQTFGSNHTAYADQMAAITGISANTINVEAYERRAEQFGSGDPTEFAVAARELENAAAASYTALFDEFTSIDAQTVVSSIVVVNGRMATVLADLAGISEAGEIFEPDADIIAIVTEEDA